MMSVAMETFYKTEMTQWGWGGESERHTGTCVSNPRWSVSHQSLEPLPASLDDMLEAPSHTRGLVGVDGGGGGRG